MGRLSYWSMTNYMLFKDQLPAYHKSSKLFSWLSSSFHGIQSHDFMANRWGNNRNSDGLYFLGLQNYCSDCSHEIKRWLLHGRKALTNLGSMLKGRDVTLPTKAHIVKAMVFPVVVYGYESWIVKKAEGRRPDAFKLLCWRRLLKVPWTGDQASQS